MASLKLKLQESKPCRTIKPALLKDYLLDDLSSCSSNGFKSFPRRQCCTTPLFLLDKDLKFKPSVTHAPIRRRSLHEKQPQTAVSSTVSVFQKASEAVVNAVKLLSIHKRSSISLKSGFLSRSFSRKVFKRTFWKKKNENGHGEIHHWKTFHNLISEFPETPPYCIPITTAATAITSTTITPSTTTTITTTTTDSKDSSKSSSWSENEFTSEVRSGGSSLADTADKEKEWVMKDEKQQFSPVSVLESPFHGEDENDSSPTDFDSKLVQLKGSKKKVMKRHGRFKTLAEMEPINLDNRLAALSEMGNNEITDTTNLEAEKAQKLLEHVKSRRKGLTTFCADNLLLDFFMESFNVEPEHKLAGEALSYLSGERTEMGFDWRVEASRKRYITDMEKGGTWKHVEDQRKDLVKEFEEDILVSLLSDLMSELVEN